MNDVRTITQFNPRPYVPLNIPKSARRCKRCTILMPIPGQVEVSQYDKRYCDACGEKEHQLKERNAMIYLNAHADKKE